MYLTVHNQLTLLHDLLDEQVTFRTVSHEEYQQIKKLVQTIIANKNMDSELLNILPEIYHYGMKGEVANSFTDHINEYEPKIEKWLEMINRSKKYIS